jgi:hypothetical protein
VGVGRKPRGWSVVNYRICRLALEIIRSLRDWSVSVRATD